MATRIISFGYKHGTPIGAQGPGALVIDVREGWRNPWAVPGLRGLMGWDPEVAQDIRLTIRYAAKLQALISRVQVHRGPVYLGCAGGRHRSVYLAREVGRALGVPVSHIVGNRDSNRIGV